MKKERLLYFESLRGIAALTVALYHFQTTSSSWLTDNAFVLKPYYINLMAIIIFILK